MHAPFLKVSGESFEPLPWSLDEVVMVLRFSGFSEGRKPGDIVDTC